MAKVLHILNGDSTKSLLEKSELEGDVVVCRELFCEGKIIADIGSDQFWKHRYNFFQTAYNVNKLEYFDKTIKEFVQLEDVSKYDEVVLWFEYDLFCQVNLMVMGSYLLKNYRSAVNYYLVCVGKEHPKDIWKTLSDYSPEEYVTLYNNKIKLSRHDLLFIREAWDVYVKNDKEQLKIFNFKKSKKIKYFDIAMRQHMQRFADAKGLDEIDYKILGIIREKPLTKNKIIRALLLWQKESTVYGFGDLQYVRKLKNLGDYYHVRNNEYFLK